jgi:hypothetical protein
LTAREYELPSEEYRLPAIAEEMPNSWLVASGSIPQFAPEDMHWSHPEQSHENLVSQNAHATGELPLPITKEMDSAQTRASSMEQDGAMHLEVADSSDFKEPTVHDDAGLNDATESPEHPVVKQSRRAAVIREMRDSQGNTIEVIVHGEKLRDLDQPLPTVSDILYPGRLDRNQPFLLWKDEQGQFHLAPKREVGTSHISGLKDLDQTGIQDANLFNEGKNPTKNIETKKAEGLIELEEILEQIQFRNDLTQIDDAFDFPTDAEKIYPLQSVSKQAVFELAKYVAAHPGDKTHVFIFSDVTAAAAQSVADRGRLPVIVAGGTEEGNVYVPRPSPDLALGDPNVPLGTAHHPGWLTSLFSFHEAIRRLKEQPLSAAGIVVPRDSLPPIGTRRFFLQWAANELGVRVAVPRRSPEKGDQIAFHPHRARKRGHQERHHRQ